MVDAAMIQQCADPSLPPAIVQKFIAAAGSSDPLSVIVRSGNRAILISPPRTAEQAIDLVRSHLGRSVVRVGITQYPAGVGINDPSELSSDLVDACKNIRMGTALFGKVYRIVVKWYGRPNDNAFDDAVIAWKTGSFEGQAVFTAEDPRPTSAGGQVAAGRHSPARETMPQARGEPPPSAEPPKADDPHRAGIRIDISAVGRSDPVR